MHIQSHYIYYLGNIKKWTAANHSGSITYKNKKNPKKTELCIQKQSYTPLLINNLLGSSEENVINRTNSAGLQ